MTLASSSYYYRPITDMKAREHSDRELRDHIERLQGELPGYGYRRLVSSCDLRDGGQRQENPTGPGEISSVSNPLAELRYPQHRFEP